MFLQRLAMLLLMITAYAWPAVLLALLAVGLIWKRYGVSGLHGRAPHLAVALGGPVLILAWAAAAFGSRGLQPAGEWVWQDVLHMVLAVGSLAAAGFAARRLLRTTSALPVVLVVLANLTLTAAAWLIGLMALADDWV